MVRRALSRSQRDRVVCAPVQVLNFYSTIFADQLKRGRKTATIRLGDKSHKYRKNQAVLVTIGYQHSPREKVFHAVIDKVEVKRVKELSPRDIEHDNPEFRRTDEMVHFLEQIYGRDVDARRHRHRRALLADHREPARDDRAPARHRRRPELGPVRRGRESRRQSADGPAWGGADPWAPCARDRWRHRPGSGAWARGVGPRVAARDRERRRGARGRHSA